METGITDEACLIIDELNALMIRNETEEYLLFKKVDQRKLRDITKKVNAVIRHIEADNITKTKKLAMAAALWIAKEVGVKNGKRGEKKEQWWKRRIESIANLRMDINRLTGKDNNKLEGNERARLNN